MGSESRSWSVRLRRGQGPFWGTLKRIALAALTVHLPVMGPTRLVARAAYGTHEAGREGLLWTLRFFYYEPLFRSQCAAVGRGLRMEQLPYLSGRGRLILGDRVRLSGKSSFTFGNCLAGEPPLITLGDRVFVGHGCSIRAAQSVQIGRGCLLAGGVTVTDYDGHPIAAIERRLGRPNPPDQVRPVIIGDDVWVGQGAIILKGVSVGPRAIIGAGAVVARDVPADVIVAGNPARVVKTLDAPSSEGGTSG